MIHFDIGGKPSIQFSLPSLLVSPGGSGGGKPDSAMGGGKDVTKVDNALALVDDYVASKIQ